MSYNKVKVSIGILGITIWFIYITVEALKYWHWSI
jgi:hypothetical protein